MADIYRYFGFVADVSRYSVLVEFGGFLKCEVDFSGNFRLMDPSGFLRLLFKVIIAGYKAFLLAVGGGK